jgi:uncharacterized RmlC-like cupin family protein
MSDQCDGDNKILYDPYMSWSKQEGVPIIEAFGVDLLDVPTAQWPRFDTHGAIVHVTGREDFLSIFVLDLPPSTRSSLQRHLYEEVVYVLSGHGCTTIETSNGPHTFEWGPKSLFALPLNARYRHFNTSGVEHARLASANNFCAMLNLFHSEAFIFENPFDFPERQGPEQFFKGDGNFVPGKSGRNLWETNFIPDLTELELKAWTERGAGGSSIMLILADGVLHAHTSQMPVGTYKKAHRHGADTHVFSVTGHGYSLLWYEGDKDFVRVDWQHGVVFAPPDQMYHQHFNTSPEPSRYFAVCLGSLRYPFTTKQRKIFLGVDVNVRDGGYQIEYADQDPRIHLLFLEELAKYGVKSKMAPFIDETGFQKAALQSNGSPRSQV